MEFKVHEFEMHRWHKCPVDKKNIKRPAKWFPHVYHKKAQEKGYPWPYKQILSIEPNYCQLPLEYKEKKKSEIFNFASANFNMLRFPINQNGQEKVRLMLKKTHDTKINPGIAKYIVTHQDNQLTRYQPKTSLFHII